MRQRREGDRQSRLAALTRNMGLRAVITYTSSKNATGKNLISSFGWDKIEM